MKRVLVIAVLGVISFGTAYAAPKAISVLKAEVAPAAQELAETLGSRVTIRHGKGRGRIIIEYFSLDDFERIRRQIKGP
ncbi:MAG: hypothetical protein AABY92_07700 [Thermodesulfobacteriota bacterium]